MFKIILLIIVVNYANARGVPFLDCGSKYKIKTIQVENCIENPCPLFMNERTKFKVNMQSVSHSKFMNQTITVNVKNIKTNLRSYPDVCTFPKRPCPVNLNDDASFETELEVPDIAPFEGSLQWTIINDKNEQIMCFEISVILCYRNDPISADCSVI